MTKPLAGGKLNQPARNELFISSSLATQAAKEGIANFECRRLSTTASCVLRNTSRGVGDPAVARACVCRNTSERNITVMCRPQLWNTSRLKLTLHPNGPRGTTAIMTANRTKRFYPMNHVTNLPLVFFHGAFSIYTNSRSTASTHVR